MMNVIAQNVKWWRAIFVLAYLALFAATAILIRHCGVSPLAGMAILLSSMLLTGILMLQVFRGVICKQCPKEAEENGEPTT